MPRGYTKSHKSWRHYKTSQEDFIKNSVPKSAQTQCTDCGKWISKYWKEGTGLDHVMTVCALCDIKRNK